MIRPFVKMHGIGNDYIYFDCMKEPLEEPEKLAVKLSDRHFSVGGDGIVLILPSACADAKMRMFNADGSEGMMCGNAIRCVGKYLHDVAGVKKDEIAIETNAGVKTLWVAEKDERGGALAFRVDMGSPELSPPRIPARFAGDRVVGGLLDVAGVSYRVTCLSMGNPHCVVFVNETEGLALESIGPQFENSPVFPQRVNTEFVQVLGKNRLKMRVWERGSGETLACGTGACAAAVAAVLNGFAEENAEIAVELKGGTLRIVYTGETVFMTGPAEFAFAGIAEI